MVPQVYKSIINMTVNANNNNNIIVIIIIITIIIIIFLKINFIIILTGGVSSCKKIRIALAKPSKHNKSYLLAGIAMT
jgi:hypothetical protein